MSLLHDSESRRSFGRIATFCTITCGARCATASAAWV
jgi:hypothetical protein